MTDNDAIKDWIEQFLKTPNDPIIKWSNADVLEAEIEYRMKADDMTRVEAIHQLQLDSDFLSREYKDMCEELTEIMQRINPEEKVWKARVSNFGWRRTSGFSSFHANTGASFLQNTLPHCECSFKIFITKENDAYTIAINNAHHDSPTWREWYYIQIAETCAQCGDMLEIFDVEWKLADGTKDTEDGKVCERCYENYYEPEEDE